MTDYNYMDENTACEMVAIMNTIDDLGIIEKNDLFLRKEHLYEDLCGLFGAWLDQNFEKSIKETVAIVQSEGAIIDDEHKERFEQILKEQRNMDALRVACAYILSSSEALFEIYENNIDDFERGNIQQKGTIISEGEYLLLSLVRDLCDGGSRVQSGDLVNDEIGDVYTRMIAFLGIACCIAGKRILLSLK